MDDWSTNMRGFITIIALLLPALGPACSMQGGEQSLLEQGRGQAQAAAMETGSMAPHAASLTAEGMPRFSKFDLPVAAMPYSKGQWVWAAVPLDYGFNRWTIVQGLFIEAAEGHGLVSALSAALTPSAFIHPLEPAGDLKPGHPVLVHKGLEAVFGRVVEVTDEGISVSFHAGKGAGRGTFQPDRVMSLLGEKPVMGAPVVFRAGQGRAIGRLVLATETKACVLSPAGELLELPAGEVEFIPLSRIYAAGAQVMVQRPVEAGILEPAVVTEVMPGGAVFKAKTQDHEIHIVSYACIGPASLQTSP
jgi:hypothetical protein